jgi:hypothetical protein
MGDRGGVEEPVEFGLAVVPGVAVRIGLLLA